MKNNYIFDTNFISSLVNKHDENHKKALEVFSNLPSICNFYLPDTVYLELIIFQLKYFKNTKLNLKNIINTLKINRITTDQKFIDNFYDFCHKTNLNLKTIDYTVLYSSFLNNANLLTFDKKLQKAYNILRSKSQISH